jgi:hypothetical protein
MKIRGFTATAAMSERVREVTGFKKEPRESWPRLGSEKTRRRSVRPEPGERG